MALSKKRKKELEADIPVIKKLYDEAVERWGSDKVGKDLSRLWDLRCMWGMSNIMPFGSTVHKNISELSLFSILIPYQISSYRCHIKKVTQNGFENMSFSAPNRKKR